MWRSEWKLLKESGYLACAVIYQDGSRAMILQHREVMENFLKRRLREDEVVHHVNEVKTDNRIDNLQVMTRAEHARLHAKLRAA